VSLTFYLLAADMSATLESEAALSNSTSRCDGAPKPCRSFNADRQAIQTAGERNELVSRITLGVGIAFTGLAGYLWYKEISKGERTADRTATTRGLDSLVAAPAVGTDYVGGAAMIKF
jgi:branched-subunit amino acid ABC-type transport system permease component